MKHCKVGFLVLGLKKKRHLLSSPQLQLFPKIRMPGLVPHNSNKTPGISLSISSPYRCLTSVGLKNKRPPRWCSEWKLNISRQSLILRNVNGGPSASMGEAEQVQSILLLERMFLMGWGQTGGLSLM
jgi:hypothetical protein